MRSQILSVLISDVQGYTALQSRSSRSAIQAQVMQQRELLVPVFKAFGGRVVKSMGDAFLVAFESPTNAVLAAVQVQRQLATITGAEPMRVRIAITSGEVNVDEAGDLFGEPVNLAARLQAAAEPGEVWLSEATFLSMNRNEVEALEVGTRLFKGIPHEVRVYKILGEFIAKAPLMNETDLAQVLGHVAGDVRVTRSRTGMILALVALGVVLALGYATGWFAPATPSDAERLDALRRELYAAAGDDGLALPYRDRDGASSWYAKNLEADVARLGGHPRFVWLRATWHMLNEPLADGVPELVRDAITANPDAQHDVQFAAWLRRTLAYAQSKPDVNPTAAAQYTEALKILTETR